MHRMQTNRGRNFKLVLVHIRRKTSYYEKRDNKIKHLDYFYIDDPHDDCTHWVGKI